MIVRAPRTEQRSFEGGLKMARPLNVEGPVSPDDVDAAYKSSIERHERERLLAIRSNEHR